MPARVHLSKNELAALIEETKINGNDASLLEQLLAEITPEKPVKNQSRIVPMMEQRKSTEASVSSPEEMERLRDLACPHIKSSPFWEEFVSRRVLVCNSCKEIRPGKYGEQRQPPLL
jgi:hypothetical protein